MNNCACGCGRLVRCVWAKGHHCRGVPPTNKKTQGEGHLSSDGYIFIRLPSHPRSRPNGYVKRAVLVVERVLGRFISEHEDVHHVNGVKTDDRPENLAVLSHSAHARYHITVATSCRDCGRTHKARGLCSSCYGKYQRAGWCFPLPASRGNRWSTQKAAQR